MGGGGGSSDFDTAEVVITLHRNGEEFTRRLKLENFLRIEDDRFESYEIIMGAGGDSVTYTVPLYKGNSQYFGMYSDAWNIDVETTGGVEYDEGDVLVTGDGTATINITTAKG